MWKEWEMLGTDIYPILCTKGIGNLYHANSVKTSNSLLQLGGLASRGCVEEHRLPQTAQYTDPADQHFGIWGDVFTDSVDIHERTSTRNQYGPVVFILDARLLLQLQNDVEVLVTKTNPTKWANGQSVGDRYFTSTVELTAGLTRGTFDQMITFRTADGIIPFGNQLKQIVLDDPQVPNVFATAQQSLRSTAAIHGILVPIVRRTCSLACKCVTRYSSDASTVQKFF